MRFSLYINPQTRGPEDDTRVLDAVTEQAIEADADGFAAIHLTEHHFTNYNAFSDPFMFGAYLAPRIQRARIGFSVAVPPLHHPLRFAEHCNLLDQFTRGRAIIGVGVGGGPIEFAGFGRSPDDKRALTDAVLDVALKAWDHQYGDPALEFDTPFFKGRLDGRIIPSSYRKPRPTIARACVSDDSVKQSAERGWPIFTGRFGPERTGHQWSLYRETLRAANHAPEIVRECLDWSAMLKIVYVADTNEQARRDVQEPLTNYLRAAHLANAADRIESQVAHDGVGSGHAAPSVAAQTRADFVARATIIGSPDTVAAEMQTYADVGVTQMMLWLTWGYNDSERVRRSMRLFVDEVMPRFDQRAPSERDAVAVAASASAR